MTKVVLLLWRRRVAFLSTPISGIDVGTPHEFFSPDLSSSHR